jgi:diketogulonate reductase-like aldo/keto reductase
LNEQVAQSFEVSKKNLGVSDIDGLILHSPLETLDRTMVVWQAMEQIHRQGEVKLLGISNCYDLALLKQINEAASIKPAIVQNRFYEDTDYDHELRQWGQEHKMIYQSFWTLTANPQILSSKIIVKAAQIYKKTAAQILFRALIDMGIVPLTGTCSDKHMREDLEIFNFDLPLSIIQEVQSLFSSN